MSAYLQTRLKRLGLTLLASVLALSLSFSPAYGDSLTSSQTSTVEGIGIVTSDSNEANPKLSKKATSTATEDGDLTDEEEDEEEPLVYKFTLPNSPVLKKIEQTSSGLMLRWTPVLSADGYIVFRRLKSSGSEIDGIYRKGLSQNVLTLDREYFTKDSIAKTGWIPRTLLLSSNVVSWIDTKAFFEQEYEYTIVAYKRNNQTINAPSNYPYLPLSVKYKDLSLPSATKTAMKLRSPKILSIDKKSGRLTIQWRQVPGAHGYIVQCSRNSAFTSRNVRVVRGGSNVKATFKGLSKTSRYCVRVRAFTTLTHNTTHSLWKACKYTKRIKYASMSRLMYKYKVKVKVKVKKDDKSSVTKSKNNKASTKSKSNNAVKKTTKNSVKKTTVKKTNKSSSKSTKKNSKSTSKSTKKTNKTTKSSSKAKSKMQLSAVSSVKKTASNSKGKDTVTKIKYVTKTKPFELRARAGQKMGRYDTMQGGCSDGKFMYFCLLNKLKVRCKIAKVSIKTKRVVKVSKPMKLNHANGMAYNSRTKRLVVVHAEGNRNAISEINKNTLKKLRTHEVYRPSYIEGASQSKLVAIKGFGSIAYSAKENAYVCLLYKSHNVVVLDSNFNMVRYITLSKKRGQIYQCIEVVNDSILIGESFGPTYAKRYNILSTYDWDGRYVTTTRLQKSYELENVFVAGNTMYAGFYRSYSHKGKFMRDNYVYRINTF